MAENSDYNNPTPSNKPRETLIQAMGVLERATQDAMFQTTWNLTE